jgi:hypothetical protein
MDEDGDADEPLARAGSMAQKRVDTLEHGTMLTAGYLDVQ